MATTLKQLRQSIITMGRSALHSGQFERVSEFRGNGLRVQTVDPETLSIVEQRNLANELYTAHNQIFAGPGDTKFFDCMFCSGAAATRIRIYRRQNKDIVGYAAIHRYRLTMLGDQVTVFRAEAGLLPGYRAQGRTFAFYIRELVKYRLQHPFEPMYFSDMLVHPSSYVVFARCFKRVFPRHDQEIPVQEYQFMLALADEFRVPPVDQSDPLIRDTGWTTRQAKHFWETSKDPDIAFFRQRNPGYRQGHGLLVLVPISLLDLVQSVPRNIADRLNRRLAGLRH